MGFAGQHTRLQFCTCFTESLVFAHSCKSLWSLVTHGSPVSVPAGLGTSPLCLGPQADIGIMGTRMSL